MSIDVRLYTFIYFEDASTENYVSVILKDFSRGKECCLSVLNVSLRSWDIQIC